MGRVVVFLGPDGAGKSSLIAEVAEGLRRGRVDVSTYYFAPGFLQRYRSDGSVGVNVTTDPHNFEQYPPFVAAAKLGLLMFEFLGGILRLRDRGEIHLFDRYIYDLAVDPTRYRMSKLGEYVLRFVRFAPKPDLVVVVEAPCQLIQTRKSEVPPCETMRQLHEYRNVKWGAKTIIVNNVGPIEQVAAPIIEEICRESR